MSKLAVMGRAVLDEMGHPDWQVTSFSGKKLGAVGWTSKVMLLNVALYDRAPVDTVLTICHELAHIESGCADHDAGFQHHFARLMGVKELVRVYTALERVVPDIRSAGLN